MTVFRSHNEVPDSITFPTLRRLAEEWVTLNQNTSAATVARFGVEGCYRLGDIVDLYDRSSFEERDAIFYRLAFPGSQLGRRVILQILLPRMLSRVIGKNSMELFGAASGEQRLEIFIADVWTAIDDLSENSRSSLAMTVLRRAYCAYSNQFPHREIETLYGDDDDCGEPLWGCVDDVLEPTPAAQLSQIFEDALAQGFVSESDLKLLYEVYLAGDELSEAISTAAHTRGVSRACVRKRCERIRTRLAKAAC